MLEVLVFIRIVAILRAVEANAAEGVSEVAAAAVEQTTSTRWAACSCDEKQHPGDLQHGTRLPPVAGKHGRPRVITNTSERHAGFSGGQIDPLPTEEMPRSKIATSRSSSASQDARRGLLRRCHIKVIPDKTTPGERVEGTKRWLAAQREGRFAFVFTPKHGSSGSTWSGKAFLSEDGALGLASHPGGFESRTPSNGSWHTSTTSIASPLSTRGPTKSHCQRDRAVPLETPH